MEALWQSLSADPAAIESPAWHEEELAERERKIESGEAKFVEWEKAKADIRRRDNSVRIYRSISNSPPAARSQFTRSYPRRFCTSLS